MLFYPSIDTKIIVTILHPSSLLKLPLITNSLLKIYVIVRTHFFEKEKLCFTMMGLQRAGIIQSA
jgi:hypothetical protein